MSLPHHETVHLLHHYYRLENYEVCGGGGSGGGTVQQHNVHAKFHDNRSNQ